jgi:hypothetical protein
MGYRYLGSIFRGPLTGVTIGYYPILTRPYRLYSIRENNTHTNSTGRHENDATARAARNFPSAPRGRITLSLRADTEGHGGGGRGDLNASFALADAAFPPWDAAKLALDVKVILTPLSIFH